MPGRIAGIPEREQRGDLLKVEWPRPLKPEMGKAGATITVKGSGEMDGVYLIVDRLEMYSPNQPHVHVGTNLWLKKQEVPA